MTKEELEIKANQLLWQMLGVTEDMLSDEVKEKLKEADNETKAQKGEI